MMKAITSMGENKAIAIFLRFFLVVILSNQYLPDMLLLNS